MCVEGVSEQCCAGDPLSMVGAQFYIASDVQQKLSLSLSDTITRSRSPQLLSKGFRTVLHW